jgi:hypothetical protein
MIRYEVHPWVVNAREAKAKGKKRREVRREVNPQNPARTPCSESWPLLSSRLAMATMADAPRPAILFADSFFHDRLCQHVDEVL